MRMHFSGLQALIWLCLGLACAGDGTLRVMMIHNSFQSSAGWKTGFKDFFVPYLNAYHGGFNISGDSASPYKIDVVLCEQDLSVDTETKLLACVTAAANGTDLLGNPTGDIDALIVGTSSGNAVVQTAAEAAKIPNLHCSGGNPAMWTAATPHAFGLHLPFPWYSRGPIRQAGLVGVKSVVVIRDHDWGFPRISAVAAMEWSLEANLKVIGPTLAWCTQWANFTTTCRVVNSACRCGLQSEWDALGYKYKADSMPSFYEIAESKVAEEGFYVRGEFISPKIVEYVRGIIQDVRSQGEDPEMVVNWMAASRSGLMAMALERFSYSTYFGGPNVPGTKWNGYESYFQNGSEALQLEHVLYNVGGGQWHHDMGFSDPLFGSSGNAVKLYTEQFGEPPGYDAAACMAAGIAVSYGLQKYGDPLDRNDVAVRRQQIRLAVGNLNDETLYGMVRFNRFNQNNGRMSVNWQVLEDGGTKPVLPPDAAATPWRYPSPSWDARFGCPPGSHGSGSGGFGIPVECAPCGEGTYMAKSSPKLTLSSCEQCPKGVGTMPGSLGTVQCESCPLGRMQNGETDQGVCNSCPHGMSRGSNDSDDCQLCKAGRYAAKQGLEVCDPCPAFSSQPDRGQTFCICDIGAYKDPSDLAAVGVTKDCLPCDAVLPGSTTFYPDSKHNDSCVCPEGSFWWRAAADAVGASCKACGKGLKCPGGYAKETSERRLATTLHHQPPLQDELYSAGPQQYIGADPDWIVSCENVLRCSGNLPLGICPGLTTGIACAACVEGAYDDGSTCADCGDWTSAIGPFLAILFLLLLLLGCVLLFAMRKSSPHHETLATITITGSLCAYTFQTLSSFSKLSITWIEPFASFKGILGIFTLNIGIIRPGCWTTVSPIGSCLGSLLLYPCCAIVLCIFFAVAKYVVKRQVTWNKVINAQGMLLTASYIALTFLGAQPFQCVANPDGTSSLLSYRAVTCWNEEHLVMLVLSIPALLLVLAFLALQIMVTMQYKANLMHAHGVDTVKRYSFLFQRFTPDLYYFALIASFRNLSVGLLPAVTVSSTELQFICLTLAVGGYTILQAKLWPWRTELANMLDASLNLLLLLLLVIGSMMVDFEQQSGSAVLQGMLYVVIIVMAGAFPIVGGYLLYRVLRRQRTYGIFLSHHKAGAAVLSRWFKMLLSGFTKKRIFLDSDDVNKLDAIIDCTAYDSENVVVLMTSQTLERMWCAAEIASAYRAKTPIVLVSCDNCGFTTFKMDMLQTLWTDEQVATLASSGVSLDDIMEAYTALSSMPCIQLKRTGASWQEHNEAAKCVMSQIEGGSSRLTSRLTISGGGGGSKEPTVGAMYMVGDVEGPESGACCRVLQSLLQSKLHEAVVLLDPLAELSKSNELRAKLSEAKVILVVLTQGILEQIHAAALLASCPEEAFVNLVPVKADEGFVYPTPQFWQDLAKGTIIDEGKLLGHGVSLEKVSVAFGKLFNVLALKFTSHGSQMIQNTEVEVLGSRLAMMLSKASQTSAEAAVTKIRSSTSVADEPKELLWPVTKDEAYLGTHVSNADEQGGHAVSKEELIQEAF
eukprot:TRINITY_DN7315_c0_g1_i1.p1 TRINITY_DN7315_c0_g1~~TRINITY_DN7315_c0_g1_i1.p1  ORF type:complete len:1557 (-),score=234.42 TRINITY_DN7315_c0_g1_i1:112-4782(-)